MTRVAYAAGSAAWRVKVSGARQVGEVGEVGGKAVVADTLGHGQSVIIFTGARIKDHE